MGGSNYPPDEGVTTQDYSRGGGDSSVVIKVSIFYRVTATKETHLFASMHRCEKQHNNY